MSYTEQTNTFVKQVQKLFRSKGWVYKRRTASAQEELTFTNPRVKETITLCGWHGQKGWSVGRAMQEVHHFDMETFKPISVDIITDVIDDYDAETTIMLPKCQEVYQDRLDQAMTKLIKKLG